MANRLPPHRIDEIFRHLEAGVGIRATARLTGHSPVTVRRYRRVSRAGLSRDTTILVFRLPSATVADRLRQTAAERGEAPALLAGRLVATILDEHLTDLVLA